jgi:hypothetical protein
MYTFTNFIIEFNIGGEKAKGGPIATPHKDWLYTYLCCSLFIMSLFSFFWSQRRSQGTHTHTHTHTKKPLDIRPEYSVSTSVGWAPEIAPNPLSRQCLVLNYQRTSSDSHNKHGSQILKKLHHHPWNNLSYSQLLLIRWGASQFYLIIDYLLFIVIGPSLT